MTEEKAISTSPEVASADTKADIKQSVAINEPQPGPDAKAETTVSTPNEQKEDKQKRKSGGFWGCLLDLFLVLLLTGALGGGGWYIYQEMERYRVPSQMELAMEENVELCRERDELRDAAFHADEQLHMRQRLSGLDEQLADLKRRISDKKASLTHEHERVIALQNEILKDDSTLRGVARGLLPGMPIGDATSTRGKVYRNAVIHRLQGNRITLRYPEGQASFPVRELVKDTLPDIARYAFGLDDLVDTSDFEIVKGQPAPKKRKGKLISTKNQIKPQVIKDYEPTPGAPTVDTNAAPTSTITADDEAPAPAEEEWEMPADSE